MPWKKVTCGYFQSVFDVDFVAINVVANVVVVGGMSCHLFLSVVADIALILSSVMVGAQNVQHVQP